ncbi:MAG TPA: hypothetical protein VFZ11_01290, partial [Gemmatimonadaceae bacterium]
HAERVIHGGVTVERALADLDAEVNRILEKRRWMLERAGTRRSALGTRRVPPSAERRVLSPGGGE